MTLATDKNYIDFKADRYIEEKKGLILFKEIKKIYYIFWAAFNFDVIHFNFGSTISAPRLTVGNRAFQVLFWLNLIYRDILQIFELFLYKIRGIKLLVHYQGSDARIAEFCINNYRINHFERIDNKYQKINDFLKKRYIRRLDKFCNNIFAVNPDLLNNLPGRAIFIPYCHIALNEWVPCYNQLENRPIRIGHAPSNRATKGTDLIINAIDRLRNEGYEVELVLVEGISNVEARKRYETIDVLVDQLFAGWYGGLAVEAMALGKPVLVYIREEDLNYIPSSMKVDLPFIRVEPNTLNRGLKSVLDMSRKDLLLLAKKSRLYVEKWHNEMSIANEISIFYNK